MTVQSLWGEELAWIENDELREKTARVWQLALERSVLSAEDLQRIPFTLKAGPDMKVSFMAHKRAVVHVAKEAALKMQQFFGDDLPVNLDTVIAGAILCDVGKLLEYELDENG
ncbi:MAG TPA: phosphohydrolase, partial [Anaerolineae bacterium]|nr:phosphohydrolase [Anaerolineae bacterium]